MKFFVSKGCRRERRDLWFPEGGKSMMSAAEGVVTTTSLECIDNYQQFFPNGHLPGLLKPLLASSGGSWRVEGKKIKKGIFTFTGNRNTSGYSILSAYDLSVFIVCVCVLISRQLQPTSPHIIHGGKTLNSFNCFSFLLKVGFFFLNPYGDD